mmetsp:Transcript_13455/g.56366  ORF Transcript_13455/g.56366 Transcript_13455/m.56366 type:complete len:248 (+) Transcript_13455:714-1457(+)
MDPNISGSLHSCVVLLSPLHPSVSKGRTRRLASSERSAGIGAYSPGISCTESPPARALSSALRPALAVKHTSIGRSSELHTPTGASTRRHRPCCAASTKHVMVRLKDPSLSTSNAASKLARVVRFHARQGEHVLLPATLTTMCVRTRSSARISPVASSARKMPSGTRALHMRSSGTSVCARTCQYSSCTPVSLRIALPLSQPGRSCDVSARCACAAPSAIDCDILMLSARSSAMLTRTTSSSRRACH